MLGKAIAIAAKEFADKTDKGGKPYMLHCLHVMHKVGPDDQELMAIAVLHDLVEDTDWTFEMLRDEGFSDRVINALRLLTHYPIGHSEGKTYDDYIKGIATNEDARAVKLEDLKHNSDITRMKGLRKKDFDRLEKYHRSYEYLKF